MFNRYNFRITVLPSWCYHVTLAISSKHRIPLSLMSVNVLKIFGHKQKNCTRLKADLWWHKKKITVHLGWNMKISQSQLEGVPSIPIHSKGLSIMFHPCSIVSNDQNQIKKVEKLTFKNSVCSLNIVLLIWRKCYCCEESCNMVSHYHITVETQY